MGGVVDVQDVMEFMACGAMVVAIGSSGLREPCLAGLIAEELEAIMAERGLSVDGLVGCAHEAR